jgi:hypothetical protein
LKAKIQFAQKKSKATSVERKVAKYPDSLEDSPVTP